MPGKTAWVAGANGLIGQSLCQQLCENGSYETVYAFVRNETQRGFEHSKLQYVATDWDAMLERPDDYPAPSGTVDALFCALGSTKKKTPDQSVYKRIDVEFPLAFARLGLKANAHYYALVSAHGASSKTPSFYLNMKAEVEKRLKALSYERVAIARPSLLLGDRNEFRLAEKASEFFAKLLPGNLKAIEGHDVAAALIKESLKDTTAQVTLASSQMQGALSSLKHGGK